MSSIYGIWDKKVNPISLELSSCIKDVNLWWNYDSLEEIKCPGLYLGKSVFNNISEYSHKIMAGRLPFQIIADVRLDNRGELNIKLKLSEGDQLSDTDFILKVYDRYREDSVEHLIGAFAFVIYYEQDHSLFCVCDHLGVKSFYYSYDGERLIFGTEKKSILSLSSVDCTPNWEYIMQDLMRYRKKKEDTEYLYIKRLSAASTLTINRSGVLEIKRYWQLDTQKKTAYSNEVDYVTEFILQMKCAVADRMHNTSNIGGHLSGGMDSSGISGVAASLAKGQNRELHAFSYTVPKEKEKEELPFENPFVMDQVRHSGIINLHRVEQPIFRTARENIEEEVRILDGFSATNNLATEYEILHCAKEDDVDVILSGFSGDELVTSFARPDYLEYLERGEWLKYFTSKHRGEYSFKKLLDPFLLKISQAIGGPLFSKQDTFHHYLIFI